MALPSGVLFLTLLRRISPVLIDCRSGNRPRSRSDCVPFPTPGAPMIRTRAAFLSLILPVFPLSPRDMMNVQVALRGSVVGRDDTWWGNGQADVARLWATEPRNVRIKA